MSRQDPIGGSDLIADDVARRALAKAHEDAEQAKLPAWRRGVLPSSVVAAMEARDRTAMMGYAHTCASLAKANLREATEFEQRWEAEGAPGTPTADGLTVDDLLALASYFEKVGHVTEEWLKATMTA